MIFHNNKLTESLIHLYGAFINNLYKPFLYHLLKHASSMLLTLEEYLAAVVGTDHYDAEVLGEVMHVDIQDVLFLDAWDADGGPSLTVLHGRIRIDVVEDHSDIS